MAEATKDANEHKERIVELEALLQTLPSQSDMEESTQQIKALEEQLKCRQTDADALGESLATEQKSAQRMRDLEVDVESRSTELSDQCQALKVRLAVGECVASQREEQMVETQAQLTRLETDMYQKDQEVQRLQASLISRTIVDAVVCKSAK